MNYKESQIILEKVKAADKILLSCHHHPDSDTVGAATVLAKVFRDMGKTVKVICPDHVPEFLQFLEGAESIEYQKFEDFNFSEWDLFVVCDTATWKRLFISTSFSPPEVPTIVIDNHSSNKGFGDINLLDYTTSSVCELLYFVFEDWGVDINKSMAMNLLAGIIGDTGSFQYEVHEKTFHTADKLIKLGADIGKITNHLFENLPFKLIKFWGLVIQKLTLDETGFVYAALSYDEYKDYVHLYGTRETAASFIIQKIANTKFGFIMTEEEPGSCSMSFRSNGKVDTAKIAVKLGGGGHPDASGAWLRDSSFDEALRITLEACREAAGTSS